MNPTMRYSPVHSPNSLNILNSPGKHLHAYPTSDKAKADLGFSDSPRSHS